MMTHTLGLEKQGHRYIFSYQAGAEDDVLEQLMFLADDSSLNFDWLDAAAMGTQVMQWDTQCTPDASRPIFSPDSAG